MIKKSEWDIKREKAIKSSCYNFGETKRIRLKINKEKIEKYIKKHKLGMDLDSVIEDLKQHVYLNPTHNNEKDILNQVYRDYEEKKRMFPKLYWKEYVYSYDPCWNDDSETYAQRLKRANTLITIKDYLNKHPELHGATGNSMQEEHNAHETIYKEIGSYSWRAWGALMAAYMNSKEGKRKYDYMSFYM